MSSAVHTVFALLSAVVACSAQSTAGFAPAVTPAQSCCDSAIIDNLKVQADGAKFGFVIGNSDGPCCTIDEGLSDKKIIHIWSASKWVTGYIILKLIDQGKLSLSTRASEILAWWTSDSDDDRSGVTVRHLLAQTDGMSQFKVGSLVPSWGVEALGMCPAWDTVGCAKHAYKYLFERAPGEKFRYSETSFYVLGAIAMQVTGHDEYDAVFQELIARPLGMTGCKFDRAVVTIDKKKADPGAGLKCSIAEYSKFLRAAYAKELVSTELQNEAEMVQTSSASNMPQESRWAGDGKQHYSLGHWIQNFDDDGVLMQSMGADGFFPWIWRQGRRSHWGIVSPAPGLTMGDVSFPNGAGIAKTTKIFSNVFPLVRLVMQESNPTTTTPTTSTNPTTTTPTTSTTTESPSLLISGSCSTMAMRAVTALLVAVACVPLLC